MVLLAAGFSPLAADIGELPRRVARRHLGGGRRPNIVVAADAVRGAAQQLSARLGATALAVLYGSVIAYAVSRYRLLSETRMFQLLMLRMVPPIVIVAPLSLYYSSSACWIRCSASACSISSAACLMRYG